MSESSSVPLRPKGSPAHGCRWCCRCGWLRTAARPHAGVAGCCRCTLV